jgi:hypothetical protein
MNTQATLTDAMRRTSQAYAEGLAAVMKAIGDLPRESGEFHRHALEQWLSLARTNKDGFVAAVNQGFDMWERECRRVAGAPHPSSAAAPGTNPMQAWLENWQRAVGAMTTAGGAGEAYRDLVRRQTELVQQALLDGVRMWGRLWQPSER